MLRIKFRRELGPKKGEVINNGNKHIFEELHNLNLSRTVVNVINLRSVDGRCLDQSGRYGKFVFGSLKAKGNLEDPDVDWRMILKWI